MGENNRIKEVVKEYILDVDSLDIQIRARITKRLNLEPGYNYPYEWEISHYCKPSEEAIGPYIPSGNYAENFASCEAHLMSYLKSFTNIGVIENKYY